MVRKTFAVALLCLTLLFCGLDSSAVGHPAEPETALHAMVHGHHEGASTALMLLASATFVALAALVPMIERAARPSLFRRFVARTLGQPSVGWHTVHAKRGPPALA